MTAAAPQSTQPLLRFELRPAIESDMPYVLNSWRRSWRPPGRPADDAFALAVRRGVLAQPDTQIVCAVAEYNPHRIWGWLCSTPGLVPVVHYVLVRPADAWVEDSDEQLLRGHGIAWALLAASGVTRELVYTFRPRSADEIEAKLLAACRRRGVTAIYRDVRQEFLRLREEPR